MARFLRSREYLTGRKVAAARLIEQEYPVDGDVRFLRGVWQLYEGGGDRQMHRVHVDAWAPVLPKGSEVMLPPWEVTPQGWYDRPGSPPPPFDDHRYVTNDPTGGP